MQCHHIRNLSNKNYIFHGFLSTQQQKLRVIIFSSVRFLSKKVTKPNFKKKNRNRVKPVWLGFFSFLGFGLVFSGFGSVFFGVVRFSSGKTSSNRFGSGFPVWLGFGSVFSGFGSVFFGFGSVFFL